MSLSDYSSDDSLELEESQIPQKALQGLQKAKMRKKGSKTSDAGPSTVSPAPQCHLRLILEV